MKAGNDYTFYFSEDGQHYTLAGQTTVAFNTVSIGLSAINSFNGTPAPIDVTFEYLQIGEMAECICTLEDVEFADRTIGLIDAAAGYNLTAKAVLGGDCTVPGHAAAPNCQYSFALAQGGENTAGATITGNTMKAGAAGVVDVTATATHLNGSTCSKTARITVKAVEPQTVAVLQTNAPSRGIERQVISIFQYH